MSSELFLMSTNNDRFVTLSAILLIHYLLFITLSANFGVTLSGPISLHYHAILLHYQSVVTLSVNLELHYRLMLHYGALLHYRA